MQLRTHYPVTEICAVLVYPRSNVYAAKSRTAETALRQAIQDARSE